MGFPGTGVVDVVLLDDDAEPLFCRSMVLSRPRSFNLLVAGEAAADVLLLVVVLFGCSEVSTDVLELVADFPGSFSTTRIVGPFIVMKWRLFS